MNIQYITCDKCGRKIDQNKETYHSANFIHGYGSKYDGTTTHLDICWDCVDNFIKSLKINHEDTEQSDPFPFIPAR